MRGAGEIRSDINRRFGEFCLDVIGADRWNKGLSRRGELRFGNKGSLSCNLAKGRWHDFETGKSGDAFDLIRDQIGIRGFPSQIEYAANWLGSPRPEPLRSAPRQETSTNSDEETERREKRRYAMRIWNEGLPIEGTAGARYLQGRGLDPSTMADLRFHASCPFQGGRRFPAIVALMRDIWTNEPRAIHRIFIEPDGSGKSRNPGLGGNAKWSLAPTAGTAVKLSPDEDLTHGLLIAEGIENAGFAMALGFRPAWALCGSGNVGSFPVLPGIEHLTIAGDTDPGGVKAANDCVERWINAGARSHVIFNIRDKSDLNDLWNGGRSDAC